MSRRKKDEIWNLAVTALGLLLPGWFGCSYD
jgi:hypothetical protein